MDDLRTNYPLYAEKFSNVPIVGLRYLVFRDLPELVEKHVNGTKTLDYGCGPGQSYKYLNALRLDFDSVDINEHMIKLAQELNPHGVFSVIKSAEISTENDHYDFVFSSMVLHRVDTKVELFKIVKEIARVLKQGGTFMVVAPNENTYRYTWLEEDVDFDENKNLVSGGLVKLRYKRHDYTSHHYYWSEEDYREVISNSGFEVLCIHRPLGKNTDGMPWIDETRIGGLSVYIAKKKHLSVEGVNKLESK